MIADAKAHRFDVIVVHKLDRFSRSLLDIFTYFKYFSDWGVTFVSITEQFNFTTPVGKVLLAILAAFAEWYLDNLSQETKKGKRERARQGLWNGTIPFGYCNGLCEECDDVNGKGYCPEYGNRDKSNDGILIPHPKDSIGLRLAFELYASGKYSDAEVAAELNQLQHRSRGRTAPRPVSKEMVRPMLQNEFYLGFAKYKGELYVGKHPALVSQELFDLSQDVRRERYRQRRLNRASHRVYPLSGIIRCAQCGHRMRGQASKTKTGATRYYRDTHRERGGDCPQTMVRADAIEAQVGERVKGITLPASWRERVGALVAGGAHLERVERERRILNSRFDRLMHLFLRGDIDEEGYDRDRARIQRQMAQLGPVRHDPEGRVAKLLTDFAAIWEQSTQGERRAMLQAMLKAVFVNGEDLKRIEARGALLGLFEDLA
jgi:hypothetical protein